jgi:hypothetical protein
MDPKAMLKRITLYSRDLAVLVGSNDRAGDRDLEKILPPFFTEGNVKYTRISRELFEESIQKMFPFSSPQVGSFISVSLSVFFL